MRYRRHAMALIGAVLLSQPSLAGPETGAEAAIRAADLAWLRAYQAMDLKKSVDDVCAADCEVLAPNAPRAIGVPMQDKNVSHDRLLLM